MKNKLNGERNFFFNIVCFFGNKKKMMYLRIFGIGKLIRVFNFFFINNRYFKVINIGVGYLKIVNLLFSSWRGC